MVSQGFEKYIIYVGFASPMDQIRDHDKTIKNIHHTRPTDESKDSF
jgi:hypothetical protein